MDSMPAKSTLTTEQIADYLVSNYGKNITTDSVRAAANYFGTSYPTVCARIENYKVSRGNWQINIDNLEKTYNAPAAPKEDMNFVPTKDETFVPFGNFSDLKKIIKSKIFYPTFITGLSGNGKTFGVEQACAQLNRELIRVNITIETDEDDLIGGFRLVDGNTVWHNGPVVDALERGAVLLLDEIDLASNKILCLQSVLEGKGVFLKKIGRYVRPTNGFQVIATANTKGQGSDDGRFIGTNVLNEAFLERFPVTFEQSYPSVAVETKILKNVCTKFDKCDDDFIEKLVMWADVIRKTFYSGGVDEIVTTRRLVHIIQAYSIFGDRIKSITNCVNRFDDDVKQSFLELYTKVDAGETLVDNEAPF